MFSISNFIEQSLRQASAATVTETIVWFIIVMFIWCMWSAKTNKNHALVKYAPTLLTLLGIFGTFIGIVIGLLDFDQHDINGSINNLLDGLKTAFITSLVGMATSILFKLFNSMNFFQPAIKEASKQDVTPNDIYAVMKEQAETLTELNKLIAGGEDSTLISQIKLMRSDMNSKATEQKESFGEFSKELWIQLQNFSDTLSKSATEQVIEALKQVISDFNNNLTEQFGENFKQLNVAVENLVTWQDNYKKQLGQMSEQYQQGVTAITQTEKSVAHISEETKNIPSAMADLKNVMEVNQHQLSELERHLEAFAEMKDKAVEAVPEIRKQVAKTVNDIASSVQVANDHYTKLLDESDKYIQSHIEASDSILKLFVDKTTEGITSVSQKLIESSETVSKSIELAGSDFRSNTSETNNSIKEMAASIVEETKVINSTFKDTNDNLSADTNRVRDEVANSIKDMQSHLEATLQEVFQKQVSEVSRTFEALESEIKRTVGLTSEAVDKQLSAIDQSMQAEVTRVMTEMGKALASISGQFTNDYTALTQSMNDIVNKSRATS